MFYDLCGVPWTHEPQPLLIDGEGYLPDFEIESLGFRVLHEVKPLSDAARILADDQTRELRMIRQAAESADGGAITFGDPLAIATTEGRSARFGDAGIAVWYICGRHIREAQIVRAHRFEHGGR